MTKVPKMVSTKDLMYISDMFNWHLIAANKYELYLNEIQDAECKKKIKSLVDMHYQICEDLTILIEGDSN